MDTNELERAEKIQFTMLVNGPASNDSFDEYAGKAVFKFLIYLMT